MASFAVNRSSRSGRLVIPSQPIYMLAVPADSEAITGFAHRFYKVHVVFRLRRGNREHFYELPAQHIATGRITHTMDVVAQGRNLPQGRRVCSDLQ